MIKYYYINKIYFLINLIFFNILIYYNIYGNKNPTDIPELLYYNNQKIQLLIPDKKCQKTLYFESEFRNNNTNKFDIRKINLKDKNYFLTFFLNEEHIMEYKEILENHSFIRSRYEYGTHNLFLCYKKKNYSKEKKYNDYNLYKYQKVYRYLDADNYFKKDTLYRSYYSMKKLFFEDFDYMPETYCYPDEKIIIENRFKDYKFNLSDLWLIKPANLDSGRGITFLSSIKNINMTEFIISKYIRNINLINDKKYDLRLYVLITGLKPLRIYFYKEGLVRIAAEKFFLNESSINNKFIHLTNTAINKFSKNFIKPNNSQNRNSNTWNIFMYKNFLKEKNIEWDIVKEKIKDIIIKSIISVHQNLIEENERKKVDDQSFYDILGFDIIITDDFIPKLIEINFSPDLKIYNSLQKPIKSNLIIDTLNLIGITPFSRRTYKTLNPKINFHSDIDENINNALCELERPKGDFEMIFPKKENINKYKKYFFNNSKENIEFWNKIIY